MSRAQPPVTFLDAPFAADLSALDADHAFLGVPYGSPYDMRGVHGPASDGPMGVRRLAHQLGYGQLSGHYDFDCAAPMMPPGVRLADCGDVAGDPRDLELAKRRATDAVRAIVTAGAMPLVVGGDDAIPPLVVGGLADLGRLNILHMDAHVDFREEVGGVRDGYSSPIRRLRDLPFVGEIVQIGLRGVGSARHAEVDAAKAAGNHLITRQEIREAGAAAVLARLPDSALWFITIDCDALDPSVAPGVSYPEPDGLTYAEVAVFVRSLARSGRLAGIEFTEYVPALDVRSLTALAIARLLMNVITLTPLRAGRRRDQGVPAS